MYEEIKDLSTAPRTKEGTLEKNKRIEEAK